MIKPDGTQNHSGRNRKNSGKSMISMKKCVDTHGSV